LTAGFLVVRVSLFIGDMTIDFLSIETAFRFGGVRMPTESDSPFKTYVLILTFLGEGGGGLAWLLELYFENFAVLIALSIASDSVSSDS
jgi:hypothetical protein